MESLNYSSYVNSNTVLKASKQVLGNGIDLSEYVAIPNWASTSILNMVQLKTNQIANLAFRIDFFSDGAADRVLNEPTFLGSVDFNSDSFVGNGPYSANVKDLKINLYDKHKCNFAYLKISSCKPLPTYTLQLAASCVSGHALTITTTTGVYVFTCGTSSVITPDSITYSWSAALFINISGILAGYINSNILISKTGGVYTIRGENLVSVATSGSSFVVNKIADSVVNIPNNYLYVDLLGTKNSEENESENIIDSKSDFKLLSYIPSYSNDDFGVNYVESITDVTNLFSNAYGVLSSSVNILLNSYGNVLFIGASKPINKLLVNLVSSQYNMCRILYYNGSYFSNLTPIVSNTMGHSYVEGDEFLDFVYSGVITLPVPSNIIPCQLTNDVIASLLPDSTKEDPMYVMQKDITNGDAFPVGMFNNPDRYWYCLTNDQLADSGIFIQSMYMLT